MKNVLEALNLTQFLLPHRLRARDHLIKISDQISGIYFDKEYALGYQKNNFLSMPSGGRGHQVRSKVILTQNFNLKLASLFYQLLSYYLRYLNAVCGIYSLIKYSFFVI